MKNKLKCYVLIVSEEFPKHHVLSGTPTFFGKNVLLGKKIHTIRDNYDLWKHRINKVNNNSAYLSVRHWTGKPYRSKQKEITRIYSDHKPGVQSINGWPYRNFPIIDFKIINVPWDEIARNDGLRINAFRYWFPDEWVSPKALIHFTYFRYE